MQILKTMGEKLNISSKKINIQKGTEKGGRNVEKNKNIKKCKGLNSEKGRKMLKKNTKRIKKQI